MFSLPIWSVSLHLPNPICGCITYQLLLLVSWVLGVVGFILTACLSNTHAGRNGSKAGIGCLMIQVGMWVGLQPGSTHSNQAAVSDMVPAWFSYAAILLGWMLLVVAIVDFHRSKRMRSSLLSGIPCFFLRSNAL